MLSLKRYCLFTENVQSFISQNSEGSEKDYATPFLTAPNLSSLPFYPKVSLPNSLSSEITSASVEAFATLLVVSRPTFLGFCCL